MFIGFFVLARLSRDKHQLSTNGIATASPHCLEEDKRATTNVQNGLVLFFFILFYYLFLSLN